MKRRWLVPIVALVGAAGCADYDVSGESVPINIGGLSDQQAMDILSDFHSQQMDILKLVAGHARHPVVGTLGVELMTREWGDAARAKTLAVVDLGSRGNTSGVGQIHDVTLDVYNNLKDRRGEDFDREFLKDQVKVYATALALIENKLDGEASSWAWKQELKFLRGDMHQRVNQIEDTRNMLGY